MYYRENVSFSPHELQEQGHFGEILSFQDQELWSKFSSWGISSPRKVPTGIGTFQSLSKFEEGAAVLNISHCITTPVVC